MSRPKGPIKERLSSYVLPETNDYICREATRRKLPVGEFIDWLISNVTNFESNPE
jgi:hypothetical protein